MSTMKYKDLDLGTIEATFNILGGTEGAARLRRGELKLVEAPLKRSINSKSFMIHVDREAPRKFSYQIKELLFPELQNVGPDKYDLATVSVHVHEVGNESDYGGRCERLHKNLEEYKNILADCLGLDDLLAIQAEGSRVFRHFFKNKLIFGWRSIFYPHCGNADYIHVPVLYEKNGAIILDDEIAFTNQYSFFCFNSSK